ncbi:MAG: N-6 DNA methylase, partial [Methanothrix sp.]
MRAFQAVRIEGGLFAPDLFDQMLAEELPGQKPRDFGLDGRRGLTDEIAAVFADAMDLWRVFKHRLERLKEDDPGTTITRDAWVVPFLGLIGYELYYNRKAYTVGGLTFQISHRAGEHEDAPPVHIVGVNQELGRLAPSGRPRLAPHSLLQEFLNRTDALWGIVTNGRVLRLLRDSTYIRRQCYVEFDLEAIFEQRLFQDFVILYRLLHRTRLPRAGADAPQCLLERYYQHSVTQGGRVRERLRDGVEECIKLLANGFLAHPNNEELRHRIIRSQITPEDLYRQLLRLVYRFLFLLVSEDRGLISSNPLYLKHYSVSRFRQMLDDRGAYTEHHDLWLSLRLLWRLLSDDTQIKQIGNMPPASLLDLPVLDGELFEPIDLDECYISNEDLLRALWYLINYQDSPSGPPRRVNYAALDVEELGSVYESLLDYHPWINTTGVPAFELHPGSERKSTGSYYTPAELVGELVRSALEPVVEARLKGVSSREAQEDALLSIKVVDPACGSGHFLLAAARHLGKRLARIRTGYEEPTPEEVRRATRDVIARCIYGVDRNPLAVELCRVALWIESHVPGRPLTFLDHRIRCGDSLIGVIDLKVLGKGIPDDAFSAVSGENRKIASALKRQNRKEPSFTQSLLTEFIKPDMDRIVAASRALSSISDDSPGDVEEKKRQYESQRIAGERPRTACDIWTAAFFQRFDRSGPCGITTATLRSYLRSGGEVTAEVEDARKLAASNRFFHWPLEFPDVFDEGGFDVVLGNPPWEQIQLEEQEFFAARDPEIANAPNAAARKRLINKLADTRPELWQEYQNALHAAETT